MTKLLGMSVLVVVAGCPADDDVSDGPDAAAAGLEITWTVRPDLPGPVGASAMVSSMHLHLSSVRVIGDAGPGDVRTTEPDVDLDWTDSNRPEPIVFGSAPPGVYSSLELGVGGDPEAFELRGTALVNGTWWPYEVEDAAPLSSSLALALTLSPGRTATIAIELDLAAVIAAIPFADLPVDDDGARRLDSSDPRIVAVRDALAGGFRVSPP